MTSKPIHELIDACRPGHDDVDQPEFSELAKELPRDPKLKRLFERSQQLDAAIRTSFQTVTPPPGLAQRLLEAIETASSEEAETSAEVADAEVRVEPAKRSARRSFAIWTGVASLAAVAAAFVFWFQLPAPISSSERDIAELVDQWNADLDDADWQTAATVPAQDFPTWQHLNISREDRWQWVSKRRIACYDFAISGGTVRLFVMKPSPSAGLPAAPPAGYPSPAGWHVGAWQANGRGYFLAVYANGGSKDLYSRVIASSINPA